MKIKNWSQFQHFKDRRPPWIKLHREILDQRDINLISDCSFRVLVGLWLLASEDEGMDGRLPPLDDIAFRLRISKANINKALVELEPWLCHDDNTMISERYQVDVPETETEAYRKEEEAEEKMFDLFWVDFPRQRRGNKAKAKSAYLRALKENRATESEIADGLMGYVNSSEVAGGFAKGAEAWLNDDRWGSDYTTQQKQGGGQSNEINAAFDRAADRIRSGQ